MQLQTVTLFQPEQVMAPRIPGGASVLSEFIRRLQAAMVEPLASAHDTSRALVVALGPRAHAFWLLAPGGSAPEQDQVQMRLSQVPRPPVLAPIAFALLLDLGQSFPDEPPLPLPPEWVELVKRAGRSLVVDEILQVLLP